MRNKSNSKKSYFSAILLSSVLGIIITLILLTICAFIMTKKDMNLSHLKFIWIGISLIAGFCTGLTAGRYIKNKGFLWGGLTAFITSITVFLIIAVFNKFSLNIFSYIMIMLYIISGTAGGIISRNI